MGLVKRLYMAELDLINDARDLADDRPQLVVSSPELVRALQRIYREAEGLVSAGYSSHGVVREIARDALERAGQPLEARA